MVTPSTTLQYRRVKLHVLKYCILQELELIQHTASYCYRLQCLLQDDRGSGPYLSLGASGSNIGMGRDGVCPADTGGTPGGASSPGLTGVNTDDPGTYDIETLYRDISYITAVISVISDC